jgi:hypothetical protein
MGRCRKEMRGNAERWWGDAKGRMWDDTERRRWDDA